MTEQALPGTRAARGRRRPDGIAALAARLAPRWPYLAGGAIVVVYVLVFVRGLAWQWQGIVTSQPVAAPVVAPPPPVPNASSSRTQPPAAPRSAALEGAPPAQAAAAGVKVPLSPTDEPPPRDATDRYGVYYDAQGVAVVGIDADPNGVYNVPPGRQLRIGGPAGALFDVQPGGKLAPATRVRDFPK